MYDFLLTVPPISKWNLPESEDVKFQIKHWRNGMWGDYTFEQGKHMIRANGWRIQTPATLMGLVAHEMIHMHLFAVGADDGHGPAFQSVAQKLAKVLGVDIV